MEEQKIGSYAVLIVSRAGPAAAIVVGVDHDLHQRRHAGTAIVDVRRAGRAGAGQVKHHVLEERQHPLGWRLEPPRRFRELSHASLDDAPRTVRAQIHEQRVAAAR